MSCFSKICPGELDREKYRTPLRYWHLVLSAWFYINHMNIDNAIYF